MDSNLFIQIMLGLEVIIFTIVGFKIYNNRKNLVGSYFAFFFFFMALGSLINFIIKFNFVIDDANWFILLTKIVSVCWFSAMIILTFAIISLKMNEYAFKEKKGNLIFGITLVLLTSPVFIFENSFYYDPGLEKYYAINLNMSIYLISVAIIIFIFSIIVLLMILKDTDSLLLKQMLSLIFLVVFMILCLTITVLVGGLLLPLYYLNLGALFGVTAPLFFLFVKIPIIQQEIYLLMKDNDEKDDLVYSLIHGFSKIKEDIKKSSHFMELLDVLDEIQLITEKENEPEFLRNICNILVDDGNYLMAWVSLYDFESNKLLPMAQACSEELRIDIIPILKKDFEITTKRMKRIINNPKILIDDNYIRHFTNTNLTIGQIKNISAMTIPLLCKDQFLGILKVFTTFDFNFDPRETKILKNLGEKIAYELILLRSLCILKAKEEEHTQIKQKIDLIMANVNSPILVLDQDNRVIESNNAFNKEFNFQNLIINSDISDIISSQKFIQWYSSLNTTENFKEPINIKDKNYNFNWIKCPVFDKNNNLKQTILIAEKFN